MVLFPVLFWLLAGGCGLLVERIVGTRLPALLVVPVGLGTLVVVSQFTTWVAALAPLTPIILAVLALLGFVLARRGLSARWAERERRWWLAPGAMLASYFIVAAPVILAGRVTFTGYLLDTTGAIQIAGAERLLHHGHNFSTGVAAYGTTLDAYFGKGYPSGGHSLLASVGWLSGQSLIWLYSVLQALELSVLALVLVFLARRSGLRPLSAAITGTIASVPALLYAYALMGSVKEITALPMIVLMGALIVCARELRVRAGIRAVIPFAIAAAAALDAIGIAASPWVGLFGLGALLAAVPLNSRRDLRPLVLGGAGLVVATVVAGLPTIGPLQKTLSLAEGVSNSNATAVSDPGNLLRPLKFMQSLGVWLGETHRLDPKYVNQTYLLMGVVIVSVGLGVAYLVRRRAWTVLMAVAISLIVWVILHGRATEWTNAKLLVILTPTVVFLALVGTLGLMRTRRVEGFILAAAVVFGVLASDSLLYHGTNLAPTARFEELAKIDSRYSGQGPTLAPDFEEYSLYLMRDVAVDIPGVAFAGPFEFIPGIGKVYGYSYDLDKIALRSVERYKLIVLRRSPGWSRPPGNYRPVWTGSYYAVWQRTGPAPRLHIPLGTGWEPSEKPSCALVGKLAAQARREGARIAFSARPLNVSVDMARAARTPNVVQVTDLEGRPQLNIFGPARVEAAFRVAKSGRYELWLGGDADRPLKVYLDGRLVGAPSQQSGDDGTTIDVRTLEVSAGHHLVQLVRGAGDFRPDDNGSTVVDGIVLEPVGGEIEPVSSIAPSQWRSLCGRSLDWLEIA